MNEYMNEQTNKSGACRTAKRIIWIVQIRRQGQMISAVPSGPADDKPMVDESF